MHTQWNCQQTKKGEQKIEKEVFLSFFFFFSSLLQSKQQKERASIVEPFNDKLIAEKATEKTGRTHNGPRRMNVGGKKGIVSFNWKINSGAVTKRKVCHRAS
jgi:hypothetical protein